MIPPELAGKCFAFRIAYAFKIPSRVGMKEFSDGGQLQDVLCCNRAVNCSAGTGLPK